MEESSGTLVEGQVVVVRPAPPAETAPLPVSTAVTMKRSMAFDRARIMAVKGQMEMLLARRPAITLGGAFALGIVLGRLV